MNVFNAFRSDHFFEFGQGCYTDLICRVAPFFHVLELFHFVKKFGILNGFRFFAFFIQNIDTDF